MAFGVALLTGFSILFVTASLDPWGTVGRTSTEAIASPLFVDAMASNYSDRRWKEEANAFFFGAGQSREQIAFRVGVEEVVFRVLIEEGRRQEALQTVESLSRLAPRAGGWSELENAVSSGASKVRIAEALKRVDGELYAQVDPLTLDLGRWAEASRLAASGQNASYFTSATFERVLADLEERDLLGPVGSELKRIRVLTPSIPSEAAFSGLEKAFRQLILLH